MNPVTARRSLLGSTPAIIAASLLLGGCVHLPASEWGVFFSMMFVMAVAATPARSLFSEMRRRRSLARRIVIVGSGAMAVKLLEEITALEHGQLVAGVIDDAPLCRPGASRAKWLGPPSQLAEIVKCVQPARIVVATDHPLDPQPLAALLACRVRGIIVEDGLECYERLTGKIAIESVKPVALIFSAKAFRSHGPTERVARVASLITAAIGLALSAPLLAAIAVAIKIESRGPVLFVQDRAGKHGTRFGLLKFRTMRPSTGPHSEWAGDNVDRITTLGKWLRRFRLDELPQLVNVLTGEMNMVGPRPHPISNGQSFADHIAYYQIRSSIRPGLTGWAQVRYGYANNLEEETEKMRYDLYYIKNRSLRLDLSILLRTALVVVRGSTVPKAKHLPDRPTLAWSAVPASTRNTVYSSWLRKPVEDKRS